MLSSRLGGWRVAFLLCLFEAPVFEKQVQPLTMHKELWKIILSRWVLSAGCKRRRNIPPRYSEELLGASPTAWSCRRKAQRPTPAKFCHVEKLLQWKFKKMMYQLYQSFNILSHLYHISWIRGPLDAYWLNHSLMKYSQWTPQMSSSDGEKH